MLVKEDFLEIAVDVVHFWFDRFHIVMAEPDVAADAVMFLQVRRTAPPWPLPTSIMVQPESIQLTFQPDSDAVFPRSLGTVVTAPLRNDPRFKRSMKLKTRALQGNAFHGSARTLLLSLCNTMV